MNPIEFNPAWDHPDFDPDSLSPAERQKFDAFWRAEMALMAAEADADDGDLGGL